MKKAFLKLKKLVVKPFWAFIDWIEKYRPIKVSKINFTKQVDTDEPPNPDPSPPIIPPK